jgi:hypothetical protein
MTPERTAAYRRVIHTIDELGPSKLLAAEQDRLRAAADALLFSQDPVTDVAAHEALEDAERLCRTLVENGRWEQVTAMRLADDVAHCGPALLPELQAAA